MAIIWRVIMAIVIMVVTYGDPGGLTGESPGHVGCSWGALKNVMHKRGETSSEKNG
jgi:hypothetical protein